MQPLTVFVAHPLRLCAILLAAASFTQSAFAVDCKVTPPHTPSEAEQAYLHGDYDHAAALYQQKLQQSPNDPSLTAALAHVLLQQQKIKEADQLVHAALAVTADSVPLLTALGEIQYREGTPWLAATTAATATKLDTCYPQLHLLHARLYRLSSYYGTAARQIGIAHSLAPEDPAIRLLWLNTLPVTQQIAELEAYLATSTGDDPEQLAHLHLFLEHLKKEASEPHKACHLVSNTATTSIDFTSIMSDATHIRAFALDAKFNNQSARLQIDTGSTGLLISRSVADRAGLKRFAEQKVNGIGNEGERSAYTAYADDIKIGTLEFRDCQVEVLDKRSVLDTDGLIGMDVFARFLITLDYPMRKLMLGPLPQRPDDATPRAIALETSAASVTEEDAPPATGSSPSPAATKPVVRSPRDRYVAPEMKEWTRVYRVGHDLLIPASLNASSQKLFLLDTGSFTTTISPDAAREVTKVSSADGGIVVHGLSGKVDKVYTADNITFYFANLAQKAQEVVAFDTSDLSRDLGLQVSGLLGITTLGQTSMSIDYRDGLVKFAYDAHRGYAYPAAR